MSRWRTKNEALVYAFMLVAACLPTALGKRGLVVQNASGGPVSLTVALGTSGVERFVVADKSTAVIAEERTTGCNSRPVALPGPVTVQVTYADGRTVHWPPSEIEARARWDDENHRWLLTIEPSKITP